MPINIGFTVGIVALTNIEAANPPPADRIAESGCPFLLINKAAVKGAKVATALRPMDRKLQSKIILFKAPIVIKDATINRTKRTIRVKRNFCFALIFLNQYLHKISSVNTELIPRPIPAPLPMIVNTKAAILIPLNQAGVLFNMKRGNADCD